MNKTKNKTLNIKMDANRLIISSVAWLIGWFFIISFVESGSKAEIHPLILRIPIVLGSFGISYGFGLKTKDKLGLVTITLLLGFLLTYIFSIPFETYKGFVLIFTNHTIY